MHTMYFYAVTSYSTPPTPPTSFHTPLQLHVLFLKKVFINSLSFNTLYFDHINLPLPTPPRSITQLCVLIF